MQYHQRTGIVSFVCGVVFKSPSCKSGKVLDSGQNPVKAFGRLILTFLPRAALILLSFCNMITSCIESPIATKSPLGSSLILEILRLGWYCLNSPISFLQDLNFS